MYSELCNPYHNLKLKCFHHPPNTLSISSHSPHLTPTVPLHATFRYCRIAYSGLSYKWNHMICDLW